MIESLTDQFVSKNLKFRFMQDNISPFSGSRRLRCCSYTSPSVENSLSLTTVLAGAERYRWAISNMFWNLYLLAVHHAYGFSFLSILFSDKNWAISVLILQYLGFSIRSWVAPISSKQSQKLHDGPACRSALDCGFSNGCSCSVVSEISETIHSINVWRYFSGRKFSLKRGSKTVAKVKTLSSKMCSNRVFKLFNSICLVVSTPLCSLLGFSKKHLSVAT